MLRRVVKRDATGEYIDHYGERYAITWTVPMIKAPSVGYYCYARAIAGQPDYDVDRFLLYREKSLDAEFMGHADRRGLRDAKGGPSTAA